MKYEFNKVLDGLLKYIDTNIYSGMNEIQEIAARIIVGRVVGGKDTLKNTLMDNGFVRTLSIIDSDGMIDVDGILGDLKKEIAKKEKLCISIPMFGKMTFTPSDVDVLHKTIVGEAQQHEIN